MTLVRVACPLCKGVEFQSVYAGTLREDGCDASVYFGSSRGSAGHLAIVRCSGCSLVMTNPQDDGATLARVYAAHEDPAYEAEYASRESSGRTHLSLVQRYRATPGRLLDVGCATGIFVRVAREAGWDAIGVDPSAWMVTRARSRCPGATFMVSRLEDVAFPRGSFEAVTLWDVLEHVSSPVETLERAREWLVPKGWLFLSVPNVGSYVARLMGRRWVLLLREHLWYFSPETMRFALARAGFEMVVARRKAVEFSLGNVMMRLGQYGGPLAAVGRRLSHGSASKRVRLRFPIGEMDVVARAR